MLSLLRLNHITSDGVYILHASFVFKFFEV
nr:MAG TPA: hypothetical protein [Caudoviricetes sp.]